MEIVCNLRLESNIFLLMTRDDFPTRTYMIKYHLPFQIAIGRPVGGYITPLFEKYELWLELLPFSFYHSKCQDGGSMKSVNINFRDQTLT